MWQEQGIKKAVKQEIKSRTNSVTLFSHASTPKNVFLVVRRCIKRQVITLSCCFMYPLCCTFLYMCLTFFLPPPGGRQGKMPVTALEAFDLEMKSWTRYPCIPSRRAFSSCATNERSLFSLGGLQQPGPHNFYSRPHFVSTMEEYDLDQGKWGCNRMMFFNNITF